MISEVINSQYYNRYALKAQLRLLIGWDLLSNNMHEIVTKYIDYRY